MKYRHLFGPVASRRLGVSLGVDLVVHKVCSLNCLYCECGKTTTPTMERKDWVPFDRVQKELDHYWAANDDPDYITFSGSGEPCLNIHLGRVIAYIKEKKPNIRVAVLTNATLLTDPGVRAELLKADLVVPSLDGVSKEVFDRINRPCVPMDPLKIVESIQAFVRMFKGQVFLELFILAGINNTPEELALFKDAIARIRPDLVQLNSLDRPGTSPDAVAAKRADLEKIKEILGPDRVEIIARKPKTTPAANPRSGSDLASFVVETIHRRPSTCEDLCTMLGAEMEEVQAILDDLAEKGEVEFQTQNRGIFYQTCKTGSNCGDTPQ
ncbi:MAG: radical SAM protein [Desulfobacter sp.]|nr:radical SAM protein [Desulfobacter sp.]WDP84117.1 MAG: radical SAM protein [Desulfobacter sp.]